MDGIARMRRLGQRVWLDDLSRALLTTGRLATLVHGIGISGVTSNPTTYAAALANDEAEYDEQIARFARRGWSAHDVFLRLAAADLRAACDLLEPVWDRGTGRDGWVSMEVDPNFAHDAEATIREAERIHALVDRPNLYVKVPATDAGMIAIERLIGAGISVNVTLLFSLERHRQAAEAYIRGIDHFVTLGGDATRVASVASFFVSRLDTEADARLRALGRDDLVGRLGVASARLAYEQFADIFTRSEWEKLEATGSSPQWCLWASTSVKDPAERDVKYVEELIGPHTITTLPLPTVMAAKNYGRVAPTLAAGIPDAYRVFDELASAGLDIADVAEALEREGANRFAESFAETIAAVDGHLAGARA